MKSDIKNLGVKTKWQDLTEGMIIVGTHRQGTNEINPVIQGRAPHTHLDWRG